MRRASTAIEPILSQVVIVGFLCGRIAVKPAFSALRRKAQSHRLARWNTTTFAAHRLRDESNCRDNGKLEISRSMDARLIRPAALVALLMVSTGASYRGTNFIVETGDPQMAARISQAAEQFRHDLAIEWLGQAMPNWAQPCMMTVQVAPHLGAGGATTFVFDNGEVFGWRMTIQGSAERV